MAQLSPVLRRPEVTASRGVPAPDRMKRVIVAGLVVTIATVALQTVTQAIDFSVFNLSVWAFNCDKHYSVFGLASLLAQAIVGAVCLWRGRCVSRHRREWFVLGALLGVLVFVRGLTTFNATVLAVPLACVFVLLCWLTWRDHGAARGAVWGGLVLMAASLLLHKVGLAADSSTATDHTWTYQIEGMVKHGTELAGWMLVSVGIVAGIVDRLGSEIIPSRIALEADRASPTAR